MGHCDSAFCGHTQLVLAVGPPTRTVTGAEGERGVGKVTGSFFKTKDPNNNPPVSDVTSKAALNSGVPGRGNGE